MFLLDFVGTPPSAEGSPCQHPGLEIQEESSSKTRFGFLSNDASRQQRPLCLRNRDASVFKQSHKSESRPPPKHKTDLHPVLEHLHDHKEGSVKLLISVRGKPALRRLGAHVKGGSC